MYQKLTLAGYTGKDVEIRSTKNGTAVAAFSLATTKSYKDADEEWKTLTTWHQCVMYGKPAESSYVADITKGTLLLIEGEIVHRTYTKKLGKDEIEIPVYEVRVSQLKKLSKPSTGTGKPKATDSWDSLGITDADVPR